MTLPNKRLASVYSYDRNFFELEEMPIKDALEMVGKRKVAWINIDGDLDDEIIDLLNDNLEIDPYELRFTVDHFQGKAHMLDLGDAIFLTWILTDQDGSETTLYPSHYLLGPDFLVSIQNKEEQYNEVLNRLHNERSRLRRSNAGFLLYSLLNYTIEEFLDQVEKLSEDIDFLEIRIIKTSDRSDLQEIRDLRDRVSSMWKVMRHLRETSESLSNRPTPIIQNEDRIFFNELYNSIDLLMHEIDSLWQTIPQLIDIYENSTSQQLNQIVKVLTVFSVLFAPLSLLAAIFSMNFAYMPGAEHPLGYPISLLLMFIVSIILLVYFQRKGFLSSVQKRD